MLLSAPVEADSATRPFRAATVTLVSCVMFAAGCFRAEIDFVVPIECASGTDCFEDRACFDGRCVLTTTPCIEVDKGTRNARALPNGNACGARGEICIGGACVEPRCGDSVTSGNETCDGEPNCRQDCTFCGDGVVDQSEQCDDGAQNSTTTPGACRDDCTSWRCGDGVVDPGEGCDDGSGNSDVLSDACRTRCAFASCGDGVLDAREACDNGPGNSDLDPNACRTTCVLPTCGDGAVDDGEQCDLGASNSDVRANACRTNCTLYACGDGTEDLGEECDNGNLNSDDVPNACRTTCQEASCGDGVLDDGEACDNGSGNSDTASNACRTTCKPARCGDSVLDTGEACDEGDANSDVRANACRLSCVLSKCGDATLDVGEQCDNGPLNQDGIANACRSDCSAPRCGDGTVDNGETCDRGAANSNDTPDACRTSCKPARCGDGTVDTNEQCDDALANNDVLPGRCRLACVNPRCGDGTIDVDESCDDGPANNDTAPGACRTNCALSSCGDGVVDFGEECDDGPENSDTQPGACRTRCVGAVCGDGTLDEGEACDDGVSNSDIRPDSCRTDCSVARCGDGVRDLAELCDNGVLNAADVADACRPDCTPARCGDGTVDTDEACDDNNTVSGDGCSASCGKVEACGDGTVDIGEECDDGNENPVDGCDACKLQDFVSALVLTGDVESGGATERGFTFPLDAAVDSAGRVLLLDGGSNRVLRLEPDGRVTTIAGTGLANGAVDGQRAATAGLTDTVSMAIDGRDNLIITDLAARRLRLVDRTGFMRVIGGNGQFVAGLDGPDARLTGIPAPWGVAVDGLGRVFVTDIADARVRRINLDGSIQTIAGRAVQSGFSGDGGPAVNAILDSPSGIDVSEDGRVYFSDFGNHVVRVIELDGTIETVAGQAPTSGFAGDGGPATSALLDWPMGVAADTLGGVYIADLNNHRIRYVDAAGIIDTIAGNGDTPYNGDGPNPLNTAIAYPAGVELDAEGGLLIAEQGNGRLRRIDPNGTIRTLAGNGFLSFGEGGRRAVESNILYPSALAIDRDGRLLIGDQRVGFIQRLRADGTLEHVGGRPNGGLDKVFYGDNVPARETTFSRIQGIDVDPQGGVVVADTDFHRIRRIDPDGIVRTLAGTDEAGFSGDGPGATCKLSFPVKLRALPDGTVLFSDVGNHRIRRIDAALNVTTVVGTGQAEFNGDGLAASATNIGAPRGLAIDDAGRLVFIDRGNLRVRRVELDGTVVTLAGTGASGNTGDGGPATAATFTGPVDLTIDPSGNIYVADFTAHRIRRIAPDGTIHAHVGTGETPPTGQPELAAPHGDGGPAIASRLNKPNGLAWSPTYGLVWAEQSANAVRHIDAQGRVHTLAGFIQPAVTGTAGAASLLDARAMMHAGGRTFVAAGNTARIYEFDVAARGVRIVAGYSASLQPAGAPAARYHAFAQVTGVAFDGVDRLFVSDIIEGTVWQIDMLDPAVPETWEIQALPHQVRGPAGLQLLDSDTLLVADAGSHCVRALFLASGTQETRAGICDVQGFRDGPVENSLLSDPRQLLATEDGALYVSDVGNHRVRLVADRVVTTVLGTGAPSSAGSGAPARGYPVNHPGALALDPWGNLFVASRDAVREVANVDGDARADGDDLALTVFPQVDSTPTPQAASGFESQCIEAMMLVEDSRILVADSCGGAAFTLTRRTP